MHISTVSSVIVHQDGNRNAIPSSTRYSRLIQPRKNTIEWVAKHQSSVGSWGMSSAATTNRHIPESFSSRAGVPTAVWDAIGRVVVLVEIIAPCVCCSNSIGSMRRLHYRHRFFRNVFQYRQILAKLNCVGQGASYSTYPG